MKEPTVVRVEWVDAASVDAWGGSDSAEMRELIYDGGQLCTSVGYLTHDGDSCVVVTRDMSDSSSGGSIVIPRAMVKSVIPLCYEDGYVEVPMMVAK